MAIARINIGGKNKVVTIYSPHGGCKDRDSDPENE
jgi:hypothetical protein